MRPATLLTLSAAISAIVGCDPTTDDQSNSLSRPRASPSRDDSVPPPNDERPDADLANARRSFVTKLHTRGPAPQPFDDAVPPPGINEVHYASGDLNLKAWLSAAPEDSRKRPAVVYLHGGWSFSPIDWEDAAPFVEAGFVVMMPMLRAENGNPGNYEAFYGEVNDAVAAGQFVSELPYVDADNVFVAGHSVGGVLATLAAMMPSRYKASAALSGYLDIQTWSEYQDASRVVFDANNPTEIRLRNPMNFAASLRIPITLYAERGGMDEVNAAFVDLGHQAGKSCDLVIVDGDHSSMVAPSVQHAIKWYHKLMSQ